MQSYWPVYELMLCYRKVTLIHNWNYLSHSATCNLTLIHFQSVEV